MNVLVTGVNGFVGKHLARELNSQGHKVYGTGLGTAHPEIATVIQKYSSCDLTKKSDVAKLELYDIDAVINLAGLANVGASFENPDDYKRINVEVFSVLAERILGENKKIRILAISTGAVYESNQPLPLEEDSLLTKAGSPYAQSKILMEESVSEFRSRGLDCIIVRPFNHIGPGQERGFLVPDLYAKLMALSDTESALKVGNLNTKRDYTDVRDVARAYALLASAKSLEYEIYNVCSGHATAGEDILHQLLDATGKDQIKIEIDSSLIRPNDPAEIYGSNSRLINQTGWHPQIRLDQTIKDFVADAALKSS